MRCGSDAEGWEGGAVPRPLGSRGEVEVGWGQVQGETGALGGGTRAPVGGRAAWGVADGSWAAGGLRKGGWGLN